jgi:hypothetical protein
MSDTTTAPPPAAGRTAGADRAADQQSRLHMNDRAGDGPTVTVDNAAATLLRRRRGEAAPPAAAVPTPEPKPGESAPAAPPRPRPEPAPAREAAQAGDDVLDRLAEQLRGESTTAPAPVSAGAAPAAAQAAPDGLELTIGGQARRFTQAQLAEHVERGLDYTRKMQDLAARQREFTEQQRSLEALLPTIIPEVQRQVSVLEAQLGENTDWEKLYAEDREEYWRRDAIRKNYEAQQKRLAQMQQVETAEQARRSQAIIEHGHQWLAEKVPLWKDPEQRGRLIGEIKSYGREMGLTAQELSRIDDPRHVHIMLHALAWRNSMNRVNGSTPLAPVPQRGFGGHDSRNGANRGNGGARGNGAALDALEDQFAQRGNVDNAVKLALARRTQGGGGGRLQ